jgi:PmbA protein
VSAPARGHAPPDLAALEALAADAVQRARRAGATDAEAIVGQGHAFTVRASGGAVESLKQSASRSLGLRVIADGAVGFVTSSDLAPEALDDLARRAVALARFSTPDDANRLPSAEETAGEPPPDLRLWDPAVLELPAETEIHWCLELERIALAHDPRIRRTDGAIVSSRDGASALANSDGLLRSSAGTSVSLYVVPLADEGDGRQQIGVYGCSRRWVGDLETVEAIAREAARRAVARLGARRVPTAKVPVVMHRDVAASWLGDMYDAFTGEAVIKQASWLTGKLGQAIAAPAVTIVDDGRLPAGPGTSAYDGEGVPTRRNLLVDRGTLAMYEYDVYHARRAGTRSTGNGVRGVGSVPGIGFHNLFVEPGGEAPEAILGRVDRGFYMDDQGSYGFNAVTGDYSFQAKGFWIERGEKAFPVEGVTVAGTSLEMLRRIRAIGNDLVWNSSVACPTLLIEEMTVSGA